MIIIAVDRDAKQQTKPKLGCFALGILKAAIPQRLSLLRHLSATLYNLESNLSLLVWSPTSSPTFDDRFSI